jgi:hypothetical protein
LVAALPLAGCADMNATQQRALSGHSDRGRGWCGHRRNCG